MAKQELFGIGRAEFPESCQECQLLDRIDSSRMAALAGEAMASRQSSRALKRCAARILEVCQKAKPKDTSDRDVNECPGWQLVVEAKRSEHGAM